MKTTIDLPEEILHRAKIVAAQRKTTLKELVISGLTHALDTLPSDQESGRRERAARLIETLSKGRNKEAIGRLNRDELHDRQQLF
jgi:predicted exporter